MSVKYKKSKKYDDVYSYTTSSGKKLYCFRFKYYRNGKRKELQRSGFISEKSAYKEMLLRKFELESSDFSKLDSDKISFAKAAELYYQNKLSYWSENTRKRNRGTLDNHLLPILGHIKLNDITSDLVQNSLINVKLDELSPKTVQNLYETLSAIINYSVRNDLLIKNRLSHNIFIPTDDKQVIFYDQKTLKSIIDKSEELNITYELIIKTLAYTGMRISELLGLRWTDVNFNEHTISILRTRKNIDTENKTKTKNSIRTIYVDHMITELLKKYYLYIYDKAFEKDIKLGINGYIFLGVNTLQPISKTVITNMLNAVGEDLKIKIHPHAFRHTHATLLLNAGETYHYIAERLGNTPRMIEETYGHHVNPGKRKVANAFSDIMKNEVSEELSEVIQFKAKTS